MFIYRGASLFTEGHTAGSTLNEVIYFFWFNKYSPYWKISEIQAVDSFGVSICYEYNVGQSIYWTMSRIWKRSFWFEFYRRLIEPMMNKTIFSDIFQCKYTLSDFMKVHQAVSQTKDVHWQVDGHEIPIRVLLCTLYPNNRWNMASLNNLRIDISFHSHSDESERSVVLGGKAI